MNKNTNEITRACIDGLLDLKKGDSFDWKEFYPSGEGAIIQQEAEGPIDDLGLLPELAPILENTKNKEVFKWAKLIVYRLLRNTKDKEVSEYIIDLIKNETEVWKLKSLTMSLTNGSYSDRIVELSYLLKHANSEIRTNVLESFRYCDSPLIEDPLIHILSTSKSRYELWYACWAMIGVGSKKSLTVLKPLLYHKKQDVKLMALGAIADILKEDGCEFYLGLHGDKNWRDKFSTAADIRRYCGIDGVTAIATRVINTVKRKRGRPLIHRTNDGRETTELVLNIEYLDAYYSNNDIIKKAYKAIEKNWKNIHDREQQEILNVLLASGIGHHLEVNQPHNNVAYLKV